MSLESSFPRWRNTKCCQISKHLLWFMQEHAARIATLGNPNYFFPEIMSNFLCNFSIPAKLTLTALQQTVPDPKRSIKQLVSKQYSMSLILYNLYLFTQERAEYKYIGGKKSLSVNRIWHQPVFHTYSIKKINKSCQDGHIFQIFPLTHCDQLGQSLLWEGRSLKTRVKIKHFRQKINKRLQERQKTSFF